MRSKKPSSLSYIEELFTKEECQKLKSLHYQFTDKRRFIQISPLEGKILYLLIKMKNIKNIIEIGTLVGYSTLWMAKAIPTDGIIYTIERNKEHADIARKNLADYKNITVIEGDAAIELSKLEKEKQFDMIFIDGNKSGYCRYLDWAERNIKKGGLIIGDNALLFNTVFTENLPNNISCKSKEIMREFNKRLANSKKYDSIILPTIEGLVVAIKK